MFNNIVSSRLATFFCFITIILQSNSTIAEDWIYTTVVGDSLWNLSERHLDRVTRYIQLKKINGIHTPKRLQPGTQIRIPMKWINSNSVPAEIHSVQGSAELIQMNGDVKQILTPGTLIHLGDRLKSGADSSVAIKFADNTILTLHSDSIIRFDHLTAHGMTGMVDSRLHLIEGRMDTRVIPAKGPGSRFEIITPSAISAVRGTEYRTSVVTESQNSNIEVLKGKVLVSGAQKKKLIKAGYGTQVAKGKSPISPRKLLEAPTFNQMNEIFRSIHFIVSWKPQEGALQYRIEMSADNFNTILWQQFSQHLRASLPDVPDGYYSIRVRGVDKFGIEGKSAVQSIVIDAKPQAPVQLKPDEDYVIRGKAPELQWTASSEADKYRLEIASDIEFNQPLLNQDDIDSTRFVPSNLTTIGKYYWRLFSIAANGEVGPAGVIRSYEIKPLPEKVDPEMKTADDDKLVATWRPGAEGQTYQVQLANDEAFNDLEFEKNVNEPRLGFEAVMGQIRYLRIRAIESDGYQGPWGATQKVPPLPDDTAWWIPVIGLIGIILL